MRVVTSFDDARSGRRGTGGLVPTMGGLHDGHLALVRRAADECDTVLVSLFVNPLQFEDPEDLGRYPADRERDADLAEQAGADVLFAPTMSTMYPQEQLARVVVRGMGDVLEGKFRPGHFEGVTTVVSKLFAGLRPDRAYFGRKDAQQLAIVTRMTRDLSFPVTIVGCPTVRDHDGLALSSRNTYLSPDERFAALSLSRGLMEAATAIDEGERSAASLERITLRSMEVEPLVEPEYAALADGSDVELLTELDRPAFLAVAARVGTVRLIDNIFIDALLTGDGPGLPTVDRGVRLGEGDV